MKIKNLATAVACGTLIAGVSMAEDWDMPMAYQPSASSKLICPGVCPGVSNADMPGIGSSPSSKNSI